MTIDSGFVFSLIAVLVTLGGLLVTFGVLKQKIIESVKTNELQAAQIEERASKQELSIAMKRSDELLDLMRKRAEEDRLRGTDATGNCMALSVPIPNASVNLKYPRTNFQNA
jgi:hypothetical protein